MTPRVDHTLLLYMTTIFSTIIMTGKEYWGKPVLFLFIFSIACYVGFLNRKTYLPGRKIQHCPEAICYHRSGLPVLSGASCHLRTLTVHAPAPSQYAASPGVPSGHCVSMLLKPPEICDGGALDWTNWWSRSLIIARKETQTVKLYCLLTLGIGSALLH